MSESLSSEESEGSNEKALCLLGLLKPFDEDPRVSSRFAFPCKVGSRPAWLEAKNLPNRSELLCGSCNQRLEFLLQIYAPLDREIVGHDEAFHRMLYVFYCVNPNCMKERDFCKVLRSQLPADNCFYSAEFESNLLLGRKKSFCEAERNVCVVCCLAASSFCGKCHRRYYCSRECQEIDWRCGHKESCTISSKDSVVYYYFPPFLLDISEEEPEQVSNLNEPVVNSLKDDNDDDMEETEREATRDKIFEHFQLRVNEEPSQVLRYAPRGECLAPLWFRKEKRIRYESDIPPCAYCGESRVFEFQVMPQLLYYLQHAMKPSNMKHYNARVRCIKNNIDFGTIVVYTCRKSCSLKRKEEQFFYAKEYVLVQDAFP